MPGAAVVNGTVYRLPFADGAFNRILFTEVLEHIPDDEAALAELFRVLEPGGILALTTPNSEYPLLWDPINRLLEDSTGQHIQTGAKIIAQHLGIHAKAVVAAVAVNMPADRLDLRRNLLRRAPARALEQEPAHELSNAIVRRRLRQNATLKDRAEFHEGQPAALLHQQPQNIHHR